MTGFDSHKREKFQFSEEFHHADFSTGGDVIWEILAQAVDIQNLMHPISPKKSGERRCPVDNMKFCTISTGFPQFHSPVHILWTCKIA